MATCTFYIFKSIAATTARTFTLISTCQDCKKGFVANVFHSAKPPQSQPVGFSKKRDVGPKISGMVDKVAGLRLKSSKSLENGKSAEKVDEAVNWDWTLLKSGTWQLFFRFRLFYFSHGSLLVVILAFVYFQRDNLTFFTIVENVVPACKFKLCKKNISGFWIDLLLKVVTIRSLLYITIVQRFHSAFKMQFEKMFVDR